MRVLSERRKVVRDVAELLVRTGIATVNRDSTVAELEEVLAEENQSVARAKKATRSLKSSQTYIAQQRKVVERGTNRVQCLQFAVDMLIDGDSTMTLKHLRDYDTWCGSNAPTEMKELPTHEAAYEEYNVWRIKQKQQEEMKDPKFREYLMSTNPQLAKRLNEEQPLKRVNNDYSRG